MKPALLILSLAIGAVSLSLAASASKQTAEKQQVAAAAAKKTQSGDELARSDSKAAAGELTAASQREVSVAGSSSSATAAVAPKADQKKVEQSSANAQVDSFQAVDEYVHVKPEEITVNEQNKELMGEGSVSLDSQLPQADVAEHKSAADDELNAHLAQTDTISSLESSYRPYAELSPPAAHPRTAGNGAYSGPAQIPAGYPRPMQPYAPARASARPHGSPHKGGMRMPPSYVTLKGKLTGINSLISQYPHPAPGYPHQGPRHLPRGAAAGYAAFRDFVRAHASKYKQPNGAPHYGPIATQGASYEPLPAIGHEEPPRAVGYGKPSTASTGYGAAAPAAAGFAGPSTGGASYGPQPAAGYGAPSTEAVASGYNAPRATNQKTKVTMAQAYIPHLTPSGGSGGYGQQQSYTNPMLAKLYGNKAPQGVGRPEYSKDYGMVIHYPQATVYTEPMTVDQLYKLTGGGISQVIEQLQYNLAHGHRDESNMIRANNKHHIGDGITIHAKEYHAPSKNGHYVPTTAAVISTSGSSGKSGYGSEQTAYGGESSYGGQEQQQQSYNGQQTDSGVHLGAGYDRVKQAVAAGSQKYNNPQPAPQQDYQPAGYEQAGSSRYPSGQGEPLTSITNLIGSELEALYKANTALTKHLEPEIHNQLQAYAKSPAASQPLRYSNLQPRSPYGAGPRGRGPRKGPHGPRRLPPHAGMRPYGGPRPHPAGQRPHRPMSAPHRQPAVHGPRPRPHQQQAYQAAEQALSQQMAQLLHDFQSGDDQYNGKAQPMRSINQGYPHKVMQKYQNQVHHQQQPSVYGQHDGLEIPQGPNDQIGEIADLIEALKGSLELHKPEAHDGAQYNGKQQQQQGKLADDVRYLASALGQVPSYAMQVPVAGEQHQQGYGDLAGKKGASEGAHQYRQQQQQVGQTGSYQAQPEAYGQQAYGSQQPTYGAQQAPQSAGYGAQQPSSHGAQQSTGYGGQQAQQPAAYGSQQTGAYGPQQASGYGAQQAQQADVYGSQPSQQLGGYGAQQAQLQQQTGGQYQQAGDYQQSGGQSQHQSPQISHSEYSTAVQHVVSQVANAAGYQAAAAAPSPAHIAPSSYPQQQQAGGSYASEHTSVINHLVPAANVAAAPAAPAYGAQEAHEQSAAAGQQPANQIAVAAPTESQYQQAQSLSSFVDSLPSDYQELLRQPALLSSNSSVPHLAALAHESSSQDAYGGQSSAAATAGTQTAHGVQEQAHQQQQQQQQQLEGYASQQQPASEIHQAYQQAASSAASSASASHQSQYGNKQQYSTIKK